MWLNHVAMEYEACPESQDTGTKVLNM